MKNFIYPIITSLLIVLACSSPKKSFEKGDYNKAFNSALSQLKKHKNYDDNQTILNRSFERIFESEMQTYWNLEAKDDPNAWRKALKTSQSIQTKINKIDLYGDVSYDASVDTLSKYDEQLKDRYTFHYEEKGKDALAVFEETQLKVNAQNAVLAFNQANIYRQLSSEVDSLRAYALSNAKVYYSIDIEGIFSAISSSRAERVFKDAEDFSDDFLEVSVSSFEMQSDCDITVRFGFLSERECESSKTLEFTEEVSDGFETITDTSGVVTSIPKYKEISGSVKKVTLEKTMRWSIDVNVWSKTNNCNLMNNSFSASTTESVENNELSGDKNAIPSQYKNQLENNIDESGMRSYLIRSLYRKFKNYYF